MNKSVTHAPEVRERAVRMVLEHQGEHESQWAAIGSIASKIGCTPETLRKASAYFAQAERPAELVQRQFVAIRPNQLWVAGITYVATWEWLRLCGVRHRCFYAAHCRLAGSDIDADDLVLDALEQALWARKGAGGVIHHSDRGGQYLSICYTEPPAETGVASSVGSRGDSYDNALAETISGLYKTEVIHSVARGGL